MEREGVSRAPSTGGKVEGAEGDDTRASEDGELELRAGVKGIRRSMEKALDAESLGGEEGVRHGKTWKIDERTRATLALYVHTLTEKTALEKGQCVGTVLVLGKRIWSTCGPPRRGRWGGPPQPGERIRG